MKIQHIESKNEVATYILTLLTKQLQSDKKVLWLVPGGSAIPIVQSVLQKLGSQNVSNVAVSLTDERYGDIGHVDENWNVIVHDAPLLEGAKLVPVNTGETLQQTTHNYANNLEKLIQWADIKIGFFGMGADGHTAGILPNSPAASSPDYAASYDAGNFIRVTMTPTAIRQLDHAILYAAGPEKQQMLLRMQQTIDIVTMPAQALKSVPELLVFTDQNIADEGAK